MRVKGNCGICGERPAVDRFRKTLMCRECLCPEFTSIDIMESTFITAVGTGIRFDWETLHPPSAQGTTILSKAIMKSWMKKNFSDFESKNQRIFGTKT